MSPNSDWCPYKKYEPTKRHQGHKSSGQTMWRGSNKEQAFSLVAKTSVKMLTTHKRVSGFDFQPWFRSPGSCQGRPWEVVVMAQVTGFLPATWEVWIEFLAPNFSLITALAIESSRGVVNRTWEFSVHLSASQIQQQQQKTTHLCGFSLPIYGYAVTIALAN